MERSGRYSTRNRCDFAVLMRTFCSSGKRKMVIGGSVMANPKKRVPENVAGDFFVDSTCIDCDTCRQVAPEVFAEGDGYAFVHRQPFSDADRRLSLYALVSCPTGSIGSLGADKPASV